MTSMKTTLLFLKRWASSIGHILWPAILLMVCCLAFFWEAMWLPAGEVIAGNDLTNMFLHWFRFAVSEVRQGEFPLWNPYLFSGLPFAANPQPALFYPPTWLAWIMPVERALSWIIVGHVWLAGIGTYAWLRSEGATKSGALLAGVTFAFSGYVFVRVYAGHLGVITTGAWLPVILWAYRAALNHRSGWIAVVGGVPVGLSILAGHTATFLYVALGLAGYALFCTWEHWQTKQSAPILKTPLGLVSLMVLTGLALAAVQLFPLVEMVWHSTRQSPGSDFAARFSWPPGYLVTLFVPNFFGEPLRTGYWGDGIYDEYIYYVGVLPLILAFLGSRLRHRLKPFLVALGLGALLLALGQYGALHRLFYRFVPLFNATRAPARAGFLFTLAAAALAGLTASRLTSPHTETRYPPQQTITRLLTPLKGPGVRIGVAGALGLVLLGFAAFAWGRDSNPAAGRLWHQANQTALFLFFLGLSLALLHAVRTEGRLHSGLAIGLVLLDLWTFGNGLVEPKVVEESAFWRGVETVVPDPQTKRVLPWGLNDWFQNGGMPLGLRSVFGYDPLVLARYETFITSRPDPLARTYDLLNAGYIAAPLALEFGDHQEPPPTLLAGPDAFVYERPNAMPRAWVATAWEVLDDAATLNRIHAPDFDPHTTALVTTDPACTVTSTESPAQVTFETDRVNRIAVQVQSGGGLLIFSEVDYPGWEVTVDGVPAAAQRADYLLRAVCVPPGEHTVVWNYNPPWFRVGLGVTLATLGLVGLSGIMLFRRKALVKRDYREEV